MLFKHHPYDFESIYRPAYELYIAIMWLGGGIVVWLTNLAAGFPFGITLVQSAVCELMFIIFFIQGWNVYKMHDRMLGFKQEFIKLYQFVVQTQSYCDEKKIWLGRGFTWTPEQTQRIHEILKHDWPNIANHLRFSDWIAYHIKLAKNAHSGRKKIN